MRARPVRVLHIIGGLQTGGAETALARLCLNANPGTMEHRVLVLGSLGPLATHLRGAGIHVDGVRTKGWIGSLGLLGDLQVRWQPDIVQGWMYHGNLAATLCQAWACPSAALVWSIRCGLDHPEQFKPLTRHVVSLLRGLSRGPRAIIYNASSARAQHEKSGFASGAGTVIPNGIDLERFKPEPEAPGRLRAELGLSEGEYLLGFLGRIHPEKNPGLFLEALKGLPAHIHGVLAGPGAERRSPLLQPWLAEPALQGRIHLLGERTDMPRVMAGLDLCVSSSWNEGFSNVLGEAMACGTPCVATAVGDSAEIVGDPERVVPPGDAIALARAITAFLAEPQAVRDDLGVRARARISASFGMARMIASYEDLFLRLACRL